ncbi:unnamed protein product [Soboliphyme baturini]|uniref:DNA helicase n=1 Tax=Soboliphyme baturini TaxID=241478 RepID=A0A3P8AUA8_9BILA|nr:unnamed protein product [Soboliphyme baturini]
MQGAQCYDVKPCLVEKLLACRTIRKAKDNFKEEEQEEKESLAFFNTLTLDFEFRSFIHCEWKSVDELEETDKRIRQKIKRFHQKRQKCDEDEPFNPDYVMIDRILDTISVEDSLQELHVDKKRVTKRYLVKWRSLPYDESTWEDEKDVDPACKARPKASDWCKISDDPEYKCGNKLRDYQLEGLNWLLFCWYNRRNCILADEMGLGKTIQSITFLEEMCRYGIRGPFLVIAPLSTIVNWQREFENWSDINVIVYHGTTVSRQMIQTYEMYVRDEKGAKRENVNKFEALITTYEMVLADCDIFKEITWKALIIDEAHRLKNRNCKLLSELSTFKVDHRVLLTGTPLQNNVEELFSLLNFLEPQQFCNSELFLSEFGTLQTDDQVQKLQEILKPMMLRRLKEDVEKSLKPKEETIIEVELTNTQKKYYRAILERNYYYLSHGASVPSLMNTMMELRKCCNHPFLINGAEDKIITDYRAAHKDLTEEELYQRTMVQSSGKLVLIDKLLPRLRSTGHKVLIFSQMVKCLDILEEYLFHQKYTYERIDGSVRGDLRQAAIDRFSKPDSDRFIFLLCTRAGGLGINLTAADTVIIFDSDWNPQNDLQAQARCHRIGQEKFVKVYRLITRNSYEREMFDRASLKLGLDKALLQSMGNNRENVSAVSFCNIFKFLKCGRISFIRSCHFHDQDSAVWVVYLTFPRLELLKSRCLKSSIIMTHMALFSSWPGMFTLWNPRYRVYPIDWVLGSLEKPR